MRIHEGWNVTEVEEGVVHVVPKNDSDKHELWTTCLCCPKVETTDGLLVIHNSFDMREVIEQVHEVLGYDCDN